jgi:hypothetical protein
LAHAAIRRWTAPRDMRITIRSTLVHEPSEGEGVRGFLISSSAGLLKGTKVHHGQAHLNVAALDVKTGETLDFVADIGNKLSHNQFLWQATIANRGNADESFDSKQSFGGPAQELLAPWEQLAQVLLSANEFVFID